MTSDLSISITSTTAFSLLETLYKEFTGSWAALRQSPARTDCNNELFVVRTAPLTYAPYVTCANLLVTKFIGSCFNSLCWLIILAIESIVNGG